VDIFIAGDYDSAACHMRRFCYEVPLCVHLERVDYIYTGGAETGVKIGLRNYPRYPLDEKSIEALAFKIAEDLIEVLAQWSAMIVFENKTVWLSRREDT
jgi:hypothetical protein